MESLAVQIRDKEELFILAALKELCKFGSGRGPLYLVGGWPRSKLTNTECFEYELKCLLQDFDTFKEEISALLHSKQCAEIFPVCKPSRARFRRAMAEPSCVLMFRLSNADDKQYKISLRNLDGDSILADARGRDFTLNALYCDVSSKVLYDPFGGIGDLQSGLLKTVGPPQDILSYDSNLYFRLFEFSIKYGLSIHPDIIKHLKTRRDFGGMISEGASSQLKTICSAVRKFFCKSYVSKMISLVVEFDFVDFFRLNLQDREILKRAFVCLPELFELLTSSLSNRFGKLLLCRLPVQNSKAFLMKARLFMISFFFYPIQASYALEFLRVFLFDNKKLPPEYSLILKSLHRLLNKHLHLPASLDNYPFSDAEECEVLQAIAKYQCEKSCWVFLIVYSGLKLYCLHARESKSLLATT